MGVTINVLKAPNWYHPVETLNGLAGNKSLFRQLSELPLEYAQHHEPDMNILRPTDFDNWLNFMNGLPNRELFLSILKRLKDDPGLWLEFSA
jgi:hypothetical protein